MPVRLVIEKPTAADLRPYVEALEAIEDTDACPRCHGHGSDPAWPGRGFRCGWCNATGRVPKGTSQAPCECCNGKRYVELPQHEGMTQVRCPYCNPEATTMDFHMMTEAKAQ